MTDEVKAQTEVASGLVRCQIKDIGQRSCQEIVVILEVEGKVCPIVIGLAEGLALYQAHIGQQMPRPMTFDLFDNLLKLTDVDVEVIRVEITELREHTYIGNLVVLINGEEHQIDCRPSDGMIFATRAGVPIYVHESLLESV